MPSYFKTLATITVWILFITGCLCILASFIVPALDHYYSSDWLRLAVGVASLVLSVVVMKLRKSLD